MVRFGKNNPQETVALVDRYEGPVDATDPEWRQHPATGIEAAGSAPGAAWLRDRDLIHDPSRLQILAMAVRGGATFQALRMKLGLADNEVAAHAKRLEAAGLLNSLKAIGGTGLIITFTATARGKEVMEGYCDWMRDLLDGLPQEMA